MPLVKSGTELTYVTRAVEVLFTETAVAGVYTGSVSLPAGSTLEDVIIHGVALWSATTSAIMKVGDVADDDGFFIGVDLKAVDLLAGEALSFGDPGGKNGADVDIPNVAGAQIRRRFLAAARVVSGIITTVGAAGATGITRMTVVFSVPLTTNASKV